MSLEPYYSDEWVTLYHADFRSMLPEPAWNGKFDLIVADPPYGETSLEWDRWPARWPSLLAGISPAMWCFGSMRMFLDHADEFGAWKLSQDVVWEKQTSGFNPGDRFGRVHEHATFWYRGDWHNTYHSPDRVPARRRKLGDEIRRNVKGGGAFGALGESLQISDGKAFRTSVIFAKTRRDTINETEKPQGLLEPLISYGCPPGGIVLDPFAGSCSTAVAARAIGRRAVCIEKREQQCEAAAKRLAQAPLDFGEAV